MLFTRRLETALEFYRTALGYRVEPEKRTPLFQGDFILARGMRARAGVMVLPLRSSGRPGWLGLIRVANIEETLEKVRKNEGQVLHGPTPDLIGGRVAVIADPHGGVVGFVETIAPAAAKPAAADANGANDATEATGSPNGAASSDALAVTTTMTTDPASATPMAAEAGKREYGWRDPGFYEPWFDPAAIVLPPPTAFRGFGTDGRLIPLLPQQPRP